MLALMTILELEKIVGEKIKSERLRQARYSQADLATRAGIPLSTYKRIEQKGKGSITDLIKCLIALRKIEDLAGLLAEPPYSPVASAKEKKQYKKRIFKKRSVGF